MGKKVCLAGICFAVLILVGALSVFIPGYKHVTQEENNSGNREMRLVYEDKMDTCKPSSIEQQYDAVFKKNGVVRTLAELSAKKVPGQWTVDWDSLAGNCDFKEDANGFNIDSPDGTFRILGSEKRILNSIIQLSFEITCHTEETIVRAGVEGCGLLCREKIFAEELSGIQQKGQIHLKINPMEHWGAFRPFLEVSGNATIHSFRIYHQKEMKGITCVEGQIKERSSLPDPKGSDYPDCRFTAHFIGNIIKSGTPVSREILLVIDGFKDYEILRTEALKNGDKVLCSIIPYDTLSDEEQSIEQEDDLNLFALDRYYVLDIRPIGDFSDKDNALFPASGIRFSDGKKEYLSIYEQNINPPIPERLRQAQAREISKDLILVKDMLKDYSEGKIKEINKSFAKAWNLEQSKDPPGYNRIEVSNEHFVWRRIGDSYFTLSPSFSKLIHDRMISEENVDALVALKNALEANGVQLIISVIPARDPIIARIINEDYRNVVDYQTYGNIRILLEHGIEAITPSREIVENFTDEAFTYNVGGDVHPSVLVQKTVAGLLKKRLERYDLPKRLKRDLFHFVETEHRFWGYDPLKCYPKDCDIGMHKAGERIMVRKPELKNGFSLTNHDSEILVVGNSFTISPYQEYGLISWMAYSLETDCSYYQYTMNGPATLFINNLLADPAKYLKNKKIAVIQIGISDLLNEKWHNIEQLDRQLKLLSSTQAVSDIALQKKNEITSIMDDKNLDNKQKTTINQLDGFTFKTSGKQMVILKTPIELNGSRGVIVIPACLISGDVTITVNGISQKITSSYDGLTNSYQDLFFELPPDTQKLTISADGKKSSYFVIKGIEFRK